jgi:site-specific recombinase XerD
MRYHIQPVIKRLGLYKRVSWHTFRRTYTSLLTENQENVKVVQELLRKRRFLAALSWGC